MITLFSKEAQPKTFVMDGDTPITVEAARLKIKRMEEQRKWDESRREFHQQAADEWEKRSDAKLKEIEDLSDLVQAAEDEAEDLRRAC